MNCRAFKSNYSSPASMTLNPFAPTFCPQQRPEPYSFGRPKNLVATDSSKKSVSPAKVARTSITNSHSSQIEEQIHSLSAQLNQLQTSSEASIQQTTPLLQKFPLAHLKQVQYLHSAQLTVAKLHQDLESEKLERQTLQLLVFQLQKDLMFIQNTLLNQKTGDLPKPFSIDPPSEGTSALPSATPCQPLQPLPPITPSNMLFRISTLEKTVQDDLSRQKSLLSSIHSNYSFLQDKFRPLEAGPSNTILWRIPSVRFVFDSAKSAHRRSKPIADKSSSFCSPVFRTHPYGYNFIVRFHPYGIDTVAGQFAILIFAFFPGDYDGILRWPVHKVIHLSLRDQLDPLNEWTQTIPPTQEPPFGRPTFSLKNDAFAVALYKYIPHTKLFSETEGYIVNDNCYIEISFSDPDVQKSSIQQPPFPPFV